jgi:hypothetical protein
MLAHDENPYQISNPSPRKIRFQIYQVIDFIENRQLYVASSYFAVMRKLYSMSRLEG